MFGRRGYQRFDIRDNTQGVMHVLRDVVLQRIEASQWLAVSREAGVIGEVMTLDSGVHGSPSVQVRVVESRPIVVNGAVRHRMRLETLRGVDSE